MNTSIKLGGRLLAVAEQVRTGVTVYDVGTDHAYLPAYLVGKGIVPRAVASDVVEGPLSRAHRTVAEAGLADRIKTTLSDGLRDVTVAPPCDIVIAGMGGDLIARILSEKPEIQREDICFILQPMTKPEHLRRYLADNGFAITRELVAEEGKLYEILCCRYTGKPYSLADTELLVGREGVRREDETFLRMVEKKRSTLLRAAEGKKQGGEDCSREETLAEALGAILKEIEEKRL
ncbi:MAG: SAM-dependent methyltransferase [Clostridia bacterium]|nr:SAM-dependent methyltransferase [Clostridia bacterium]